MVDWRQFHRSFDIYNPNDPKYTQEAKKLDLFMPHVRFGRQMVDAKYRKLSRKAYRLDDFGLTEVRIFTKEDQDFKRFATKFELNRSSLCGREQSDPVVDAKGNVVGHIIRVGSSDIFFDRYVGFDDSNGDAIIDPFDADDDGHMDDFYTLNTALEQGCVIRVALEKDLGNNRRTTVAPDESVATPYTRRDAALTMDSILLMVDPNGLVLYELERHTKDGIESSWVDPLALIGIARLGFTIVRGTIGFTLTRGSSALSKLWRHFKVRRIAKTTQPLRKAPIGHPMPPKTPNPYSPTSPRARMHPKSPNGSNPYLPPTPRIGPSRLPELSVDEMEQFLLYTLQRNPELQKLLGARLLREDALRRQLMEAVKLWETRTGGRFDKVAEGVVQRLTGEVGNFATIRQGKLMIEEQIVRNLEHFREELVHELCAHALGGRMKNIIVAGNANLGAVSILEHWIVRSGSFQFVRDFVRL